MTEPIGHTYKRKDGTIKIQSLKDHLLNTKKYAEIYASDLSLSHVAGLAGILHDVGKENAAFQKYVVESVEKDDYSKRGTIDHSSLGAIFLRKFITQNYSNKKNTKDFFDFGNYFDFGNVVENAIVSHHNALGLKDFLSPDYSSPFLNRMNKFDNQPAVQEQLEQSIDFFYSNVMSKDDFKEYFQLAFKEYLAFVSAMNKEINLKPESKRLDIRFQTMYFISEYIYSCLLDADRTDATAFNSNKKPMLKDNNELFNRYYSKLITKVKHLNQKDHSKINKLRAEISQECDQVAQKNSGIYTLSSSTGSGKTLASLRFGLRHSKQYHKKHIIYVLPYITIIEQNASTIREILNGEATDSHNILEYHSNVSQEIRDKSKEKEEQTNIFDLAEDSWDSPIIVTTMVQFLNTIFAKSTKYRRRFHNLCNSVLIFDEAQRIPVKCLNMFNEALNFLKNFGKSNILLCTATQPALNEVEQKLDLNKQHEIIPNLIKHEHQFKRVNFIDLTRDDEGHDQKLDAEDVADLIFQKSKGTKSILGIFNTISVTKKIYTILKEKIDHSSVVLMYLSTNMCPADRQDRINKTLNLVKAGKKVICISTPLIEAGVDASFECVFRSLTGLDSIVQAAGRCNRNGEMKKNGKVYLVNISDKEERISKLEEVKVGKAQVINLLEDGIEADDFLNADVIEKYFKRFYKALAYKMSYPVSIDQDMIELADYIDGSEKIRNLIRQGTNESMNLLSKLSQYCGSETIAKYFQVIDNDTKSILAPYGKEGKQLIKDLKNNHDVESLISLIKKTQPYIVNLYENQFDKLIKEGDIYTLCKTKNEAIYAFELQGYNKLVLNDEK